MDTVKVWQCKRCNSEWAGRGEGKPVRCARCGSPYWDRERVAKKSDDVTKGGGDGVLEGGLPGGDTSREYRRSTSGVGRRRGGGVAGEDAKGVRSAVDAVEDADPLGMADGLIYKEGRNAPGHDSVEQGRIRGSGEDPGVLPTG